MEKPSCGDQTVPSLTKPLYRPNHWQDNKAYVQAFLVGEGTHEWREFAALLHKTLPSATIEFIKRNQNTWIWENYQFCRQRMDKKNCGFVNETRLFYGNPSVPPMEICQSEDGWDQRFHSKGKWGMAAYFTDQAVHSHPFAYTCGDGSKILVVAMALLGHCFLSSTEQPEMRMPPLKGTPEGSVINFKKPKYDSVKGMVTKDIPMFAIHNHQILYPAYMIKYKYTHPVLNA